MQNTKCKIIINYLLVFSLLAPSFSFAQTTQVPETIEETKTFGSDVLKRLPDAIKDIWYNQALPLWWNMWVFARGFWERTLGAKIESLWQKLWGLTGQEPPNVKEEFQKEQEEMQKDLWERFKELF